MTPLGFEHTGGDYAGPPPKENGNCPDCGTELKRIGHQPDGGKGRYKCMNRDCTNNHWMNRYGERR